MSTRIELDMQDTVRTYPALPKLARFGQQAMAAADTLTAADRAVLIRICRVVAAGLGQLSAELSQSRTVRTAAIVSELHLTYRDALETLTLAQLGVSSGLVLTLPQDVEQTNVRIDITASAMAALQRLERYDMVLEPVSLDTLMVDIDVLADGIHIAGGDEA